MWFIGVEVEQETGAPPPKKNPGSALDNILLFALFNTMCLSMFLFCFTRSFSNWNTILESGLKNLYT